MSKRKTKGLAGTSWIAVILIVCLSVGVTFGITKLVDGTSGSFSDLFTNKDNLIRSIDEYQTAAGNTGEGITWTVNKDKSITVDGKINSGASKLEFVLGEVVITEKANYTLSGCGDKASMTTCYLIASYTDAEGQPKTIVGDMASSMTAELDAGTSLVIKLVVYSGVAFDDLTVKPTLVKGNEAGRF